MKKTLLSLFYLFSIYSLNAQTITVNDDALLFNQFDASPTFNISVLTNDSGTIDPLSLTISVNPDPLVTTAVASVNPDGTITISNWDNNGFAFSYNVCNDGNPSLECFSANVIIQYSCQTTVNSISISNCFDYTAPDSQVYTTSGIYTAIIPNSAGCDSTITIDLTILNPTTSTISPSICNSYTAPDAQVYSTSGTYTAVIPNMAGCDSTITINLTITNTTSSTITRTVCGSYTAPDGQIYTTSGTKTAIIPNSNGCDSTITINLTVNTNPVATAAAQGNTTITASPAGMIYQWINCNTDEEISSATNQIIEPMSGSYAAIVTNSNGCVDTTNCVSITNTANLDFLESEAFTIYPNPTNGKITINTAFNETNSISILDLNGKKMFEEINFSANLELDLSALNSGVYFLHISNQSKIDIIKISKY